MKAADLEKAVRDLISDQASGGDNDALRWEPETLLLWINEGRKQLFMMRPEAFYVTGIVTAYPGDIAAGADTDLEPMYDAQLVDYVCYRALSRDNEEPESGALANGYLQKFLSGV